MEMIAERVEIAGLGDQILFDQEIEEATRKAREALLALQHPDGYWCFELEADCTIPAEYILMMHYMDEIDEDLEARIAIYLRAHQESHGGWPLFPGGKFDISCSVKAYYALKLAGDRPDAPHMVKAREAILAFGGAARSNVFTRITLALFGQIPWRGVPFTPVEIMLFPRWFLFHLRKVSYWSRTVMVPLTILCSLKPQAKNPRKVHIRELFITPPEEEKNYFPPPLSSEPPVPDPRHGRAFLRTLHSSDRFAAWPLKRPRNGSLNGSMGRMAWAPSSRPW